MDDQSVSKEEYAAWERQVIRRFYEAEPRTTKLTPTDGLPSVVRKVKVRETRRTPCATRGAVPLRDRAPPTLAVRAPLAVCPCGRCGIGASGLV